MAPAFPFAYSSVVLLFFLTFAATLAQKDELRLLYISELMNSGDDTPAQFVVRWACWLGIPTFAIYQRGGPFTSVPAWWICVITGFLPRVFVEGAPTPTWLQYAHYVASALLFLVTAAPLKAVSPRLFYAWIGLFVSYMGLFVAWRVVGVVHLAAWPFQLYEFATYHMWWYLLLWRGVGAPASSGPSVTLRMEPA
tara:strand:+ start:283 stop:867 length:585 start_codon:yes stop_codon:yes gene_type:complete